MHFFLSHLLQNKTIFHHLLVYIHDVRQLSLTLIVYVYINMGTWEHGIVTPVSSRRYLTL